MSLIFQLASHAETFWWHSQNSCQTIDAVITYNALIQQIKTHERESDIRKQDKICNHKQPMKPADLNYQLQCPNQMGKGRAIVKEQEYKLQRSTNALPLMNMIL